MPGQNPKFIVYKSSAGSGKTFTLVREYLKIVLNNPEAFRQVLAITFTNKAANEMKDRVVRNLIMLAEPDKYNDADTIRFMLPQLAEQLNLTAGQIKSRAVAVLRLIMHHYAEFAISTIDSFTHRVIRTFAHDLKIPVNFEVELDSDAMISEAVDLMISMVGTDEKLTRVMVDFVEKKAGEELNWQIEKELYDFARILTSESSLDAVTEIRKYTIEDFLKVKQALMHWKVAWEKTFTGIAVDLTGLFKREGLTADDFVRKKQGIFTYIQYLAVANFEKIQPNSYADSALRTGEWISLKSAPMQQAAFQRIEPQVAAACRQILEMLDRDLPRYHLYKLLLNNLFSTALLSEIEKLLNSLCLEDNKLLISEFNRRISQVIQEQPAPFIYERLGERYHHYLIDEFQDTSILQWQNLLPLVENSLASNRMNLVVGDAKQAIYRWRSGDAEQFEMLPRLLNPKADPLLEMREQALVSQFKQENLDKNHRSSPVIVDFNNRLFSQAAKCMPEGYGEAFQHAAQEAARKDKPGMVRIEKVGKDESGEMPYSEAVHRKILDIINELLEDNYPLKDIAILCRRNESAANIATFLISNKIPVISSESLLLTQSGQVNFLIAWIQHLVIPSDTIPIAHILEYLIRHHYLTDITTEEIFGKNHSLIHAEFRSILEKKLPFLDFAKLKRSDIFGLISYLMFHFRFDAVKDSYLQFFQDAVLEFVKGARGGLPEFLEWWDEKSRKLSVVIPEGIDAVRIMTVHKAKGLQFPVVIYPFADEKLKPGRKNIWAPIEDENALPLKTACLPVQKALASTIYNDLYQDEMNRSLVDLVNVLYVALTRPEERLFILSKELPDKADETDSTPKLLGSFLVSEGLFENSTNIYQFGERWQREKALAVEAEPVEESSATSRPALKMLLRRHAPSVWDMEDPEKNREWGNLMHLALSQVNNKQNLETVLANLENQGLISSLKKNEMYPILDSIIKDEKTGIFFSQEIETRNEPEIITADGHLYRPDRLVIKEDRVTVVDFKTGKYRDEHKEQVLKYTSLLAGMDYKIEGAFLLYLNRQPELLRVT